MGFLIFWIFLLFFSELSCPYEQNSGLKFFSHFLGLSHPVLAKKKAGKRFFNFLNFFAVFSQFSSPGRVWTEIRTKKFFYFFRPISSVLAKNNARKRFFFSFFFWNFLARIEYEGNSGLKFFSLFLGLSHPPFWLKIMLERGFLFFWISLLFFLQFSSPGRVWMEFGTKFFFSLFRPISVLA